MSRGRKDYKILITGPVGSGKTTAVQQLSDIEPVSTDEIPSDDLKKIKSSTTVAMDYGLLRLGDRERVHLYGTPGQARFDFMWDILAEGGLGAILLIDSSAARPLEDLGFFIGAFYEFLNRGQLVIGITHMDEHVSVALDEYNAYLEKHGLRVPVLEVDARERGDVAALVQAMLYALSVRKT
ncbi:MAG: GTP-binding protein [bacterium]